MQEAFKKVESDAFRFAGENEKLKRTIESMQEELDNLRKDAAVMRSILDRAALTATPQPTQPEKTSYIPKAPVKTTFPPSLQLPFPLRHSLPRNRRRLPKPPRRMQRRKSPQTRIALAVCLIC